MSTPNPSVIDFGGISHASVHCHGPDGCHFIVNSRCVATAAATGPTKAEMASTTAAKSSGQLVGERRLLKARQSQRFEASSAKSRVNAVGCSTTAVPRLPHVDFTAAASVPPSNARDCGEPPDIVEVLHPTVDQSAT
jgi:nitrogenase molybdenum-iron protein alpha/beta subunit